VTDVIVNAIETGTGSYRMPWVLRQDKGFSPISVSTVKPYLTDETAYADDEVAK
jgi:hypothetical protein